MFILAIVLGMFLSALLISTFAIVAFAYREVARLEASRENEDDEWVWYVDSLGEGAWRRRRTGVSAKYLGAPCKKLPPPRVEEIMAQRRRERLGHD